MGYFVSQVQVGVAAGGHFQAELVDSHSEVPHLGFGLPFSWAHHRVLVSLLITLLPECDHSINRLENGSWVSAFLCVILVFFDRPLHVDGLHVLLLRISKFISQEVFEPHQYLGHDVLLVGAFDAIEDNRVVAVFLGIQYSGEDGFQNSFLVVGNLVEFMLIAAHGLLEAACPGGLVDLD